MALKVLLLLQTFFTITSYAEPIVNITLKIEAVSNLFYLWNGDSCPVVNGTSSTASYSCNPDIYVIMKAAQRSQYENETTVMWPGPWLLPLNRQPTCCYNPPPDKSNRTFNAEFLPDYYTMEVFVFHENGNDTSALIAAFSKVIFPQDFPLDQTTIHATSFDNATSKAYVRFSAGLAIANGSLTTAETSTLPSTSNVFINSTSTNVTRTTVTTVPTTQSVTATTDASCSCPKVHPYKIASICLAVVCALLLCCVVAMIGVMIWSRRGSAKKEVAFGLKEEPSLTSRMPFPAYKTNSNQYE